MQSFQIIKPCTALAPYIRHYWILQDDAVFPVAERVLPVGCMQMVFHKGRQLLSLSESALQPQSFISGQSVGFSDVQSTGKIEMITVVSSHMRSDHCSIFPVIYFMDRIFLLMRWKMWNCRI